MPASWSLRLALVGALMIASACGGGPEPSSDESPALGSRAGDARAGDSSTDDGIWQPSPTDRWHIQYAGDLDVPDGIDVVDLDMEETPAEVIADLHERGVRVVCYLSAGSWEPYRSDAGSYPEEILGERYDGWEDERWFDIRSAELRRLLGDRIETAAAKGCDAIDPDNVNGYQNDTGFPLTAEDQLDFNRWLFDEVHARGMAVGLKNDLDQAAALVDHVEFQINEECIQQGDCDALSVFVEAGKPVWSIEYEGDPDEVCAEAGRLGFSTWIKDLDLTAGGHECPVPNR